jgi:hypothetical protein
MSAPRIAVVTAMTGGKDAIVDPAIGIAGVDFIAFTDAPQPHLKLWQVRPIPVWSSDPAYANRRHARLIKVLATLFLPDHEFVIWHDAHCALQAAPHALVDRFLDQPQADIAAFRHSKRQCAYDEARSVIRKELDPHHLVGAQIRFMRNARFPRQAGLFETPLILRRNCSAVRSLELAWWDQICRFSSRDQISLPYASWKTGVAIHPLEPGTTWNNEFFVRRGYHLVDDVRRWKPPTVRYRVMRQMRRWAPEWMVRRRDAAKARRTAG